MIRRARFRWMITVVFMVSVIFVLRIVVKGDVVAGVSIAVGLWQIASNVLPSSFWVSSFARGTVPQRWTLRGLSWSLFPGGLMVVFGLVWHLVVQFGVKTLVGTAGVMIAGLAIMVIRPRGTARPTPQSPQQDLWQQYGRQRTIDHSKPHRP